MPTAMVVAMLSVKVTVTIGSAVSLMSTCRSFG